MTQAGYSASRPLELELRLRTSENDRRVAIAAQSMWRDVFVAVELLRAETAIHYATLQAGEFDLGLGSWLAVYDDPQTFTLLAQTGAGANNLGGFADARYDELTAQAAVALDLDVRARLLRSAEEIALAEHALLPLFHHAARNIVSPAVGGWQSNNLDMHRSRYLSLR
jgi:oligopeptide transport system substrate-binding protein